MKPSEIFKTLITCYEAGRPAMVHGSPGSGKSHVMRQVAEHFMELYKTNPDKMLDIIKHQEYPPFQREIQKNIFNGPAKKMKEFFNGSFGFYDIRVSDRDPVDIRGMIKEIDGMTYWSPPAEFPRIGPAILFTDELSSAPPLVQAVCFQLHYDFKVGDYALPVGVIPMAAGNRAQDKSVVYRMASALSDRFVHLDFEPHMEDWIKWALHHEIVPEVISFIRFRPGLLNAFDAQKRTSPTPRSWQFLSQLASRKPDVSIEYELYSGIIGEGAASEYIGFLKIFRELPDPDLVMTHPDKVEVPKDPATLYAMCGALMKRCTLKAFPNIMKYVERMAREFSVMFINDVIQKDNAFMQTETFINWIARPENQNLIYEN